MLSYGYIREAVQAHLDLDEQETQAMNLQARYHIFANEAMQAICAVKPKYDYFKVNVVKEYTPIISLGNNTFRAATQDELCWEIRGLPEPNFADEIDTTKWYEGQRIFLLNKNVRMPEDFIAFTNKQAWAFTISASFDPETFVGSWAPFVGSWAPSPYTTVKRVPATKDMFMYAGVNTLLFLQEGEYWIPYKGTWFRFKSGVGDDELIDMPVDILLTIPLYVASICLQVDHAQKANAKRAEFELMLSRVSTPDFMEVKRITPTYR